MKGFTRLLVIGAGSIGRRHHQNLIRLGADSTLVSYREAAGDQLSRLLDDNFLVGVVIATATNVRLELISQCAQRNLPVYIEKPVAFTEAELKQVYSLTNSVSSRSMVGYMMRYHPFFKRLADSDLSDVYRFEFTIGHDVTQWRSDWRFADSYASLPQGGGVLLDLCHEPDMVSCLFPEQIPATVNSIGHRDYQGVDFSTVVSYRGDAARQGSVSLDYLSPVSTRKCVMYGSSQVISIDFNALEYSIDNGEKMDTENIAFDRNDMFLDAMTDFLGLIENQQLPAIKHLPRLDLVAASCESIARAWQLREFTGSLSDPVE